MVYYILIKEVENININIVECKFAPRNAENGDCGYKYKHSGM